MLSTTRHKEINMFRTLFLNQRYIRFVRYTILAEFRKQIVEELPPPPPPPPWLSTFTHTCIKQYLARNSFHTLHEYALLFSQI